VCYFLHRRLKRKQRIEDANDPHKSLDFGVDIPSSSRKGGKPGVPEMTITDLGDDGYDPMRPGKKHKGGMSLDMDVQNPYLLPAGLQGSRESIHSMSRSMQDEHDPYRPVTMLRTSTDSKRPGFGPDNSSTYSASTMHSGTEKANLLRNAQRMSRSDPMSPCDSHPDEMPMRALHSNNRSMPPSRKTSLGSEGPIPEEKDVMMPPPRKHSLPQSMSQPSLPPTPADEPMPAPPRQSSNSVNSRPNHMSVGTTSVTSMYDDEPPLPSIPVVQEPEEYDVDPSLIRTGRFSIDAPNLSEQFPLAAPQPQRMSVMGLRPLPPDHPEDNPEIRANRIRSFYKEYFDDSRPNPAQGHYEEDFDASYLDGAIYDPDTGGFVIAGARPFAEAPTRRAMTPPPRGAAPRPGGAAHGRHYSTQSAAGGPLRGRPGPPGRMMPQKRLPPPKPLQSLPTPGKLKDYDSVITMPIDFAPPTSFRGLQNGQRPDSPLGVQRPYSPAVKPFSPLAASYDELSLMPSPHHLRKSGTFTALDFAPPSRIRDPDSASDAGSIRSARSGISAMQMDAVRAGAYRVSRIPKEMVTTRDDLAMQLRPKMDLTLPA
jgi:hypothetical protein